MHNTAIFTYSHVRIIQVFLQSDVNITVRQYFRQHSQFRIIRPLAGRGGTRTSTSRPERARQSLEARLKEKTTPRQPPLYYMYYYYFSAIKEFVVHHVLSPMASKESWVANRSVVTHYSFRFISFPEWHQPDGPTHCAYCQEEKKVWMLLLLFILFARCSGEQ